MTWIKASFLWITYRAGCVTKEEQDRILVIDIKRKGLDFIIKNSTL